MKVFLSHSSADKDLARRLAHDLQAAKIDVWLDQWEVRVGEAFVQRIEQGLDEVEFVIVLLTRASVASEWVDREWRRKVQGEGKKKRIAVIPVRGEPCEMPDFLAQRSYADISGGSYPLGLRHLLAILRFYSNDAGVHIPGLVERNESFLTLLPIVTPIALEVGSELIPIFRRDGDAANRAMDELAPGLRDDLRAEFGFPFPGIRVAGNETDMDPRGALILIDEVSETLLEVGPDEVLADESVERLASLGISAQARADPLTGHARACISAADRAAAAAAGLVTWDAAEYLFFSLRAVIRPLAPLFLDIDVTRRLVDCLEDATLPEGVSWSELTDVLQRLVEEGIAIGDMRRILEALSRRDGSSVDTVVLAERARHALRTQITAKFARGRDSLPVLLLDRDIEASVARAIQHTSHGPYLALEPQLAQDILTAIRGQLNSPEGHSACVPILVSSSEVRPYVRKLVSLELPFLNVLSRQDLEPDMRIDVVALVRLGDASQNAATGQERSA